MKRGAVRTKQSELVAIWVPKILLRALDDAVYHLDTDRSKFIRQALRRELTGDSKQAA